MKYSGVTWRKIVLGTVGIAFVVYLTICTVFWIVFAENTRYSPCYTEAEFESINLGMTVEEVERKLGPSLSIDEYSGSQFVRTLIFPSTVNSDAGFGESETKQHITKRVLSYSEPGLRFESYYVRNLVFDEHGKVVDKFSGFYAD
jgi:hypothetical protein